MALGHHREKNPEQLRQSLLQATARLAVNRGIAGVTFNAVCTEAGVSKGGLQHHFATKDALIDGVFSDMLGRFADDMDAEIAADPNPHGRVVRAYVRTSTRPLIAEEIELHSAALIALLSVPRLKQQWLDWVDRVMGRESPSTDPGALHIARLAADGLWLAEISGDRITPDTDKQAVIARLIALTQAKSSS